LKPARKLWEQIQLAKSQAEDANFIMTKFRTVTDLDHLGQPGVVLEQNWPATELRQASP
jgi:hypothetical protein